MSSEKKHPRENKATGNRGILPTCDLEGHELLNLVDAPNKRGRLYRRHEAWQNVIAWLLRQVGIGITGSALGTPPTCKGIFSMATAQATGWHAMSESAAETFRRENYIIADIIVFLENLIFHNIPDEDLPFSINPTRDRKTTNAGREDNSGAATVFRQQG